ncbi:MAG: muconolactone delta-isomerase [Firmicutes bacterium]|nr:muconolactone delta-isomerase [Bacillota bacterium]
MIILANITVLLPSTLEPSTVAALQAAEHEQAIAYQRAGKLRAIWRVVGRYANVSLWEVESAEELHDLLQRLPLFPYMSVDLTLLASHPSAVTNLGASVD